MEALPCHGPGIRNDRCHRVQQGAVPMVFEYSPAALNGIIFAVVRGIIGQTDMQTRVPHKVHHALHELGAMAVIFWAVVEIDDQRREGGKPFPDGVPPLGDAIGKAVTGDFGEYPVEKDFIHGRDQDAHGSAGGLGVEIVIMRGGVGAVFPAARERPNFDHGFGIDRNAQDVCRGIRLAIDLGYVGKDRVSLWDFFFGMLLATFLGKYPRALSLAAMVWPVGSAWSW